MGTLSCYICAVAGSTSVGGRCLTQEKLRSIKIERSDWTSLDAGFLH